MQSRIPDSAVCRECGYRLRGLDRPRCPECGGAFDPADPATFNTDPGVRTVAGRIVVGVLVAAFFGFFALFSAVIYCLLAWT